MKVKYIYVYDLNNQSNRIINFIVQNGTTYYLAIAYQTTVTIKADRKKRKLTQDQYNNFDVKNKIMFFENTNAEYIQPESPK